MRSGDVHRSGGFPGYHRVGDGWRGGGAFGEIDPQIICGQHFRHSFGEELGLVGTLAVLGCFVALVACGVCISLKASDLYGQYLGLGVTLLIALQALINIGVVTAWLASHGSRLEEREFGTIRLELYGLAPGRGSG